MPCFRICFVVLISMYYSATYAQGCDKFAGAVIKGLVEPQLAQLECSGFKIFGLDHKDFKIADVCYTSTGPQSHVRIDATLRCYGSSESFIGKISGTAPSKTENATLEADVSGDCQVGDVSVKASGEVEKVLVSVFNANDKARQALQQGISKACGK